MLAQEAKAPTGRGGPGCEFPLHHCAHHATQKQLTGQVLFQLLVSERSGFPIKGKHSTGKLWLRWRGTVFTLVAD